MEIPDFSKRSFFPGTKGNPFDIYLHAIEDLQQIPWPLFIIIQLFIAFVFTLGESPRIFFLIGFNILDWILLLSLPFFHISYGPANPPSLILAILRGVFSLISGSLFLPFQLVGTALVVYGFFIEPQRLQITYQQLTTPKLKTSRPLRIIHLGDLHIERLTAREHKILEMVRSLHPDIILFSGDILNLSFLENHGSWDLARTFFSQLQAPLGIFIVSGSPAVDLPEIMPELLRGLPIHWLESGITSILFEGNSIDIAGLTCTHKPHEDAPALENIGKLDLDHFNILLYHSPDLAPQAARRGYDLQLSGHTHGGQVRIPWIGALYAGSLYGLRYQSGRYEVEQMTLYVTRGIGMEGAAAPRIRIFCPPEIILWEISGN